MMDRGVGGTSLHSPVLPDFNRTFRIGERLIGDGEPCYTIGEAGSNHDRDLKKALALVDAASAAGCDAVKFQTFSGEDMAAGPGTTLTRVPAEFERWGTELQDFYRRCSLPKEYHKPIADR